jgi:uncharacterized membrane protein
MRLVWVAVAIFVVVASALAVDRYVTYGYGADLGLFTQTIATAFHGFYNQVEHGSHFMVHFSPVLYLCVPFLRLAPSPLTLQVIQAVACALTAPAVYLFARRRTDEKLASLIAIATLLYPPLVSLALGEFHENAFAPATIAWLLWAVDSRRFGWAALFFALALGIKEDQALALAVIAIAFGIFSLRRGDRTAAAYGAAAAVASVAVFAAFFLVARPLAGATGPWFVADYYTGHEADMPRGIIAITGRLTFLLEMFAPLVFLPLLSRWIWLALPALVEVLSSRWPLTYTMGQHHAGEWLAYVLIAFAAAAASIAQTHPNRALLLVRLSMALCVLNLVVASPTHWAHFYRPYTAHDAALDRIIAHVPSNAAVGSFDEAYTHMSLNPNAQIGFPLMPDYFVYDSRYRSPRWQATIVPRLAAVVCGSFFTPVARDDGITLFRRVKDVPDQIYVRAGESPPACLRDYQ